MTKCECIIDNSDNIDLCCSPFLKDKVVLETEEIERITEEQIRVTHCYTLFLLAVGLQADVELKGGKAELLKSEDHLKKVNYLSYFFLWPGNYIRNLFKPTIIK